MKLSFRNITLASLFILSSRLDCSAQAPYFQSYHFQKKGKAVQTNSIFQDKTGIMWFGTNQGLFRFDGSKYHQYSKSDGLQDENITALAQDSMGRIWMGDKNGLLYILDQGKISKFEPEEGNANALISDILFDSKGILWFSTLGDGIYYFKNNRLYRIDESEGMPDLFVYDLELDTRGNVWAGTDGGLVICSLSNTKAVSKVINQKNGLPDNIVKKVKINTENEAWIGMEDAGISRLDIKTGAFTPILNHPWKFGSLSDFWVSFDQIWVASENHGLVVVQLDSRKTTVYDVDQSPGFSTLKVLKEDKEGNIWIGHRLGATRAFGNFVEIFPTSNTTDNHILAITIDKNENIWYSTKSGLFCKNLNLPSTSSIEKPLQKTPFSTKKIISLYTDSAGFVWAGTYGDGAIRIHPTTHQLTIFNKELSNGNVLNISGKGNKVWMATLGGATKITYKGTQMIIEKFTRKEGLVSDYIYQVFVDSKNRTWFATDRAGVDVLDPSGFTHFKKGLQTKVVFGLIEDKNHTIWANVQGEGLYRLDGDEFKPVNDSNLRDQTMGSICIDKFGNLVLANDLGINVFDINKGTVRSLGEEVGLQDYRPNLNTWSKDSQNRLYFGTEKGIVRYAGLHPSLAQFPTAHIESLYIFDTPLPISPQLSLEYDDNNITVNYQALWYQQPENLTFKYQLTPHDRNWISTRNLSAVYSRLPPGEYTFKLRASSSDNFDSSPESVLHFTIHPPFWQKTWFYMACLAAFITISYLFVHIRERHLLTEKTLLEAKVDERTKEIQSKNEEIKRQHEEISLQAEEIKGMNENLELLVKERTRQLELKNKTLEEYAFINAHQLRAPVASILGLISLIGKMKTPSEKKELVNHLHDSAHKLDTIVRSITTTIEKGDDRK